MERNRCIAVHLVGVDLLIDPCRAAAWLPTGGCGHPPLRENRECGCRGALYMRPCLVAVCGSLAGIATAHGRICNPPLQVRCGSTTPSNTYSLLLLPSQKNRLAFASRFSSVGVTYLPVQAKYCSAHGGTRCSLPYLYEKSDLPVASRFSSVGVTYLPV